MADPAPYAYLKLNASDAVCRLTLNRPEKRNALHAPMRAELLDFLKIWARKFSVVVLTGAGPGFCSGIDITNPGANAANEMWSIAHGIYDSEAIFVAAVNGSARGGGVTLVNACDLAIASETATFGLPELAGGIYPTVAGPTTQLAIAQKAAAEMILTAAPISAARAREAWLINEIVSEKKLLTRANALARQIADYPHDALKTAKKALSTIPVDGEMRERAKEMGLKANSKAGP